MKDCNDCFKAELVFSPFQEPVYDVAGEWKEDEHK